MKKVKILLATVLIILATLCFTSCGNMQLVDTVYSFDQAIVSFPDGTTKTIEIAKWRDYEDGDQIQLTAKDGTVYLVHSMNCILIREGETHND